MSSICNVTGPLIDPSGAVLPDTALVFRRVQTVAGVGDATMIGRDIDVLSDAEGLIDVDLLPGAYRMIVSGSRMMFEEPVTVPDAPEALLHNCIRQDVELTPGLVLVAAQYAADAEASADRVDLGALDEAVAATATDVAATAADRVQTGLDRVQTGADRVQTGADLAAVEDAAAVAQAAADAAVLGAAGVYASTAAGLAATTTGQYFAIPSPDAGGFLDLYLNNAGVAAFQKTYPSVLKTFEPYDMETLRVITGLGTNFADVSLVQEGFIRGSDGAFVANVGYESTGFVAVDPEQLIEIEVSASLSFSANTSNLTFYDANRAVIGSYDVTALREFVRPSDHVTGCRFVRATDYNHPQPLNGFVLRVHSLVDPARIEGMAINWFSDPSVETYGEYYDLQTGQFVASSTWTMTGLVPVYQGQKLILTANTSGTTRFPVLMGFDANGAFVTAMSTVDVRRATFTITNPAIHYVRAANWRNENSTPSLLAARIRDVPHPRVILPDEVLGMVGEGLPVFARSIVPDANFPVAWNAESSSERGFIATRTTSGANRFRLGVVVDNGRARLDLGEVNFRFYATPTNPAFDLNVICLGDSTTEGTGSMFEGTFRDWPNELSRQITGVGTPALPGNSYFTPWGLTRVFFRGTRGLNTVKHEGYGGWSGYDFLNRASFGDKTNAFWNAAANGGAGGFDFDWYLAQNGFNAPALATGVNATGSNLLVFLQLGWNLEGSDTMADTIDDIGTIIDRIQAVRSATRFCILGLPPTPDLVRRQSLPTGGRFITDEFILNEWILPHRQLGRALAAAKTNTVYYDLGPTFDAETGYTADVDQWQVTPWDTVNKYSAARDYVHPSNNGNVMIARALKSLIAKQYLVA